LWWLSLSAHITLWFIATHGIRTAENLRRYCGIEDPEELAVGINGSTCHFRQLKRHIT
jgi:glycerol 3-phosphatase-1